MGSSIKLKAQTLVIHVKPADGTPSDLQYLYGKWGVDVNSEYSHSRAASIVIDRFIKMSNKEQSDVDIVVEQLSIQEEEFLPFDELSERPQVVRLSPEYDLSLFDSLELESNEFHKSAELLSLDVDHLLYHEEEKPSMNATM